MLLQILILSALILGSITDLKKREVPDTLNYSLIVIGLFLNLALSILNLDASIFMNSVFGLGVGFLVGALFYYGGQWGGGDAKLVMGVGAVMGVNPLTFLNVMPAFILFLITSLLVGAIYGLSWLLVLALRNHKKFKKEHQRLSKKNNLLYFKLIMIFVAFIIMVAFFLGVDSSILFLSGSFVIFLTLMIYSKNFFKAVENSVLTKKTSINDVTEGDWIVEEFNFDGKKVKANKTGLSKEDIILLKKNNVKSLKVRQGIPFVPSFLFAYLTLLIVGNWLLLF